MASRGKDMQGEKQLRAKLSPMQDTIFKAVKGGRDVKIELLHEKLYGAQFTRQMSPREQQKALGPHIYRLNAKACEFGWIVRPGSARRTYRLYALEAAPKRITGRKPARR